MIPARMNARWITVISGIAIGAISAALIAIPAIHALEQHYGLQGLFDLRGPVPPPDHAVLVLMNERSADSISLPRDGERFHRWVTSISNVSSTITTTVVQAIALKRREFV